MSISNDVVNEFKNVTDEQLDAMIEDLEEELDHIYQECIEDALISSNDPPYTGHCDYAGMSLQERWAILVQEKRRRQNVNPG